jgi:YfiH family protein
MIEPFTSQAPAEPVPTVRFALLDFVPHGISTRHGGVSSGRYATLNAGLSTEDDRSSVIENRSRFIRAVGASEGKVAFGRLTHGNEVSALSRYDAQFADSFASDAVVSDVPGRYVFMTFADCAPILLADPRRRVVAAVHAGWRGTSLRIVENAVATMVNQFGCTPRDIRAGIGPSIGPCCYEVGRDVTEQFASNGTHPVMRGTRLDLWETNRRQLLDLGLRPGNIENSTLCTSCNVDTFFSHRAEHGLTGRFAACIGLPG